MEKNEFGNKENIVLIGMPGAGKSTLGVLLAKYLSKRFIDTDVYIQAIENKRLQDIINEKGLEYFCELEEEHILCIDVKNAVIATGGSAVYSEKVMVNFKQNALIIHLDLPLREIIARVTNLDSRGVVMAKGQTLASLLTERQPLYKRYADITIDCSKCNHEQTLKKIIEKLREVGFGTND